MLNKLFSASDMVVSGLLLRCRLANFAQRNLKTAVYALTAFMRFQFLR